MSGISVRIGAQTDQFEDAVGRSKTQLKSLSNEFKAGAAQAAKYGVAAAAAGAALAIGMTIKGLAAVDAQAKLARQLGATIDGMKAVTIAASDAGISQGAMASAAEKLNARIGEAIRGTGTAVGAFDRLGLSAANLSRMDVDQRMATIADAMVGMGLSTQQAGDELRQMGIRQGEVVNLMLQGGDAIRGARKEIEDYGLSLSEIDAAKVEIANDAFSRIGMQVDAVNEQLAIQTAPIITAVSKLFLGAAKEAGGFGDAAGSAANTVVDSMGFIADAVEGVNRVFQVAGKSVGVVMLGITGALLAAAQVIVSGPIVAVNQLIAAFNKIPGIDIEPAGLGNLGKSIQAEIAIVEAAISVGIQDIQDTLMEPMPSVSFKRMIEETRVNAALAAEEIVAANKLIADARSSGGGAEGTEVEAETEKARQLHAVRAEAFLAEFEQKQEWDEIMQAADDAAFQKKKDTLAAFLDGQSGAFSHNAGAITGIVNRMLGETQAAYVASFATILSSTATYSKKAFKLNQGLAIANAVISAYEGISKTLAAYPFPISAAMAAAQGAMAFAQVSAIKSQSFGGGGSAGPVGGGGSISAPAAAAPAAAQQPVERTVANVNLMGDVFSRQTVIALFEQMNDLADDGMQFRIT